MACLAWLTLDVVLACLRTGEPGARAPASAGCARLDGSPLRKGSRRVGGPHSAPQGVPPWGGGALSGPRRPPPLRRARPHAVSRRPCRTAHSTEDVKKQHASAPHHPHHPPISCSVSMSFATRTVLLFRCCAGMMPSRANGGSPLGAAVARRPRRRRRLAAVVGAGTGMGGSATKRMRTRWRWQRRRCG